MCFSSVLPSVRFRYSDVTVDNTLPRSRSALEMQTVTFKLKILGDRERVYAFIGSVHHFHRNDVVCYERRLALAYHNQQ